MDRAEQWINDTMGYFLQTYGKEKCFKEFDSDVEEFPCRANKVKTTFVTDYIKTLGINAYEDNIVEKSEVVSPPPFRPNKNAQWLYLGTYTRGTRGTHQSSAPPRNTRIR